MGAVIGVARIAVYLIIISVALLELTDVDSRKWRRKPRDSDPRIYVSHRDNYDMVIMHRMVRNGT